MGWEVYVDGLPVVNPPPAYVIPKGEFVVESYLVTRSIMAAKGPVSNAEFSHGRTLDVNEFLMWWWCETLQAFTSGAALTNVGLGMGYEGAGHDLLDARGVDATLVSLIDQKAVHAGVYANDDVGGKIGGAGTGDLVVYSGTGHSLAGHITLSGGSNMDDLTAGMVAFHYIIGNTVV